ncbi:DUF4157 domain-containing protein [Dyadobacter sp. CY261]|uniref:eCIS core domain-containing protein n=1 Tax=Dyadobacter sp. CY261 TaxID=2907203 RepID=UPI001F1EC506|nr:DUF4157 domain-containing protein [Dyadobacter sp. CY261]MCF0074348.1 DUF4157 domain-containing protein [Dyadobacter sp. CY261]
MQNFAPQKGKNEGHHAPAKAQKPFFQTKLTVNAPGDQYEQEADAVADRVMRMPDPAVANPAASFRTIPVSSLQRKCAACEREEKVSRKEVRRKEEAEERDEVGAVQAKAACDRRVSRKCAACGKEEEVHRKERLSDHGGMEAPDSVSEVISGAGRPLDTPTQHFMGSRMGQDFSDVRIHTDGKAAESASAINALAYTAGNHIVFNSGQYQPDTDSGKRLLAHELTHVGQQTGNVGRKPYVQRFYTFAPANRPSGGRIHSEVLPEVAKVNKGTDFFVEASIPGANKVDAETDKRGIADFFRAKTTIGIRFNKIPEYLESDKKLLQGGGQKYMHKQLSAPQGDKVSKTITRLDEAPENIEIGDLKPGGSSETILGTWQLRSYTQGIEKTAASINSYLVQYPNRTTSTRKSWHPVPKTMTRLTIPPNLVINQGKGMWRNELHVYEDQKGKPAVSGTQLVGSMFVYKDQREGIWSYEWIPERLTVDYRHVKVESALRRLNTEVIPNVVQSKSMPAPKPPTASAPLGVVQPIVSRIQRKEKFKEEKWLSAHYKPWKEETASVLKEPKVAEKAKIAEAIGQLDSRTGHKVHAPQDALQHVQHMDKIKHWLRFGRLYGWLRQKFDFIFTKFQGFAKRIKEKARALQAKVSGSFGSWFKAAVKVIFKIIRMVGAWTLTRIAEEILGSLQRGIQKNLAKVVEMFTPEGVKSRVEEYEELKNKYETMLAEKEEALMEKLFGKKLKLVEELSELEKVLSNIGTIVDLVKWGIRIVACLSPPLLGCLWNLAIAALEYAFSKLIETCWFSKKVYGPIMSSVDVVRDFPKGIAADVVTFANKHVPVPNGLDPLFDKINISESEFSVDCSAGGGSGGDGEQLSPQQEAIGKLIEEIGREKFEAFLMLAKARGISEAVEMDADRLRRLKSALQNLSKDALEKAASAPRGDQAVALEAFLGTLKDAKPAEELAKPKENYHIEDYDKVAKKNRKHQAEIGWKPETFRITGDKADDAKKMAEAIYVMQQMLGLKADGIAGPETVIEYYERNNLKGDRIYRKAKESKENANIRKLIASGYPSNEQLLSDLKTLQFGRVENGSCEFSKIGKNYIFWGKTAMGSRVGSYIKIYPTMHESQKRMQVVGVSTIITLDRISSEDSLEFDIEVHAANNMVELRYGSIFIGNYPANSVLNPAENLLGGLIPSHMLK